MSKRPLGKTSIERKHIKACNDAYYKALSARDMRVMEKLWTCASDNMLIAPPTNPRTHVGWAAIKRNWESYWPTAHVLLPLDPILLPHCRSLR